MKKIFLFAALFFTLTSGFTQDIKFGITAGYLKIDTYFPSMGFDNITEASGFYTGISGDFKLSKSFHLEPEIIYGYTANERDMLFIPIHAKYYVGNSRFNLLAGPQASIIVDRIGPAINKIGWDLSLGTGYDVTDNLFLRVKYAFEISDRNSDKQFHEPDGKAGINSLLAGIGYRF